MPTSSYTPAALSVDERRFSSQRDESRRLIQLWDDHFLSALFDDDRGGIFGLGPPNGGWVLARDGKILPKRSRRRDWMTR